MPADADAVDGEGVAELRRVDDVDFEEKDVGVAGYGLSPRCSRSLAVYSAVSPACRRVAMMLSWPSWARESVMRGRAVASNSRRSARNSVVRETREFVETLMMPTMNRAEVAMPSGFSMMFSISA